MELEMMALLGLLREEGRKGWGLRLRKEYIVGKTGFRFVACR